MKTVIVSFGMGLVLLGLGGCSGPKGAMETYPVQGEVLLNGQPATEAVVILHPRFDYDKTADPPRGEVNDEGVFEPAWRNPAFQVIATQILLGLLIWYLSGVGV